MSGFGAGDLSFPANQTEVNWAHLGFDITTQVILDVDYSTTTVTPEPATILLSQASGILLACRAKKATES